MGTDLESEIYMFYFENQYGDQPSYVWVLWSLGWIWSLDLVGSPLASFQSTENRGRSASYVHER